MRTLALTAALVLSACGPEADPTVSSEVEDSGTPETTDEESVEADVADQLLFMREEEKLARDVYGFLEDAWPSAPPVFTNIGQSEQTHMDALLGEIERLGLTDPVVDDARGVFQDDLLAGLYVDLTTDGSASLEDALAVGALIEDLDIVDLQEAAAATDDATLVSVYAKLECGSRNHLRAFTGQLELRGVTYAPQYLSVEAYEAIVGSPHEGCN